MKKTFLVFQIDALRYDYISQTDTPFIYSLKKESVSGTVIPTFGFEPDAAYWAGLYPDECDSGAQFLYNPQNSPFKRLKHIPKICNNIPPLPDKILRKLIAKVLKKSNSSPVFGLPYIPFGIAHNFDFTFDKKIESDDYLKDHETIFKLLKSNGKKYFIHTIPDFNVNAISVLNRIQKDFKERVDFAFFMIGDLDRIGHKYGPNSDEIKKELFNVDHTISKIFKIINERFGEFDSIIFGDHGMCEVNRLYNIQEELNSTKLRSGKDYLYFIDSTMARFWFFNENAEKIVRRKIGNNNFGHIITDHEISKYHLNYINNKMGELFFIAEPGVLLFPNFYQKHKPVKGMHGYLPEVSDQQSLFIINSKEITNPKNYEIPIDMRRLFPTIIKLLGLEEDKLHNIESLF